MAKTNANNDLEDLFVALKKKLKPYANKLLVQTDRANRYELCGDKNYEVTSLRTGKTTQKSNAYFVGIIVQSNYVGFYLMAPYMEKGFMDEFSVPMRKRLKGKTCFHFKNLDEVTSELDKLLKKAFNLFKKRRLA